MSEATKVAVITGASSGIGKEAARGLLQQGWHVIALGRDLARSAAAEADLKASAPQGRLDMIRADLALLSEAARAAAEISALTDHVNVLMNNAGGMADKQYITTEGHEATFTGNYLGPFLLTQKLLPLLHAAAQGSPSGSVRIINTSSTGSEQAPGFDWDDIEMHKNFVAGRAYCNAKLANILHARALTARYGAQGIVAHAMHPGVVGSNFISHTDASTQVYMNSLDLRPPEEAAQTLLWLATSSEPSQPIDGYYYQCQDVACNPMGNDPALADRLWDISEKMLAAEGY